MSDNLQYWNSFIISPPILFTTTDCKQTQGSFFTYEGAELETDEVHGVDSSGGRLCQSLRCGVVDWSARCTRRSYFLPVDYMLNN